VSAVKLAALPVALLLYAAAVPGEELRAGAFSPPRQAPAFVLRGSDGADLDLAKYRGKVVALGFGYTHCPDVCPTTLHNLARARKALGDSGRDFQVVYVTVDPARDDVKRMREYVAAFDATFLGATGAPEQLAKVRKDYGIEATRADVPGGTGYYVHHSSFVYLIDRGGVLRAMMPYGTSTDDVVHDVRLLLGVKP
jgi:protein SCO1/2